MEQKLNLAKELLKKNHYMISYFNEVDKKNWESYNVSLDILRKWIFEYLESLRDVCFSLIKESLEKNYLTKNEKEIVATNTVKILIISYIYKIDYYKQVLKLISQLSDSGLLVDCMNIYGYYSNQVLNEGLFLFDKYYETNYIYNAKQYYYDIEQEYCGLLPFLYQNHQLNLFEDLFQILLDNFPLVISFNKLTKYCNFIKREDLLSKVNEAKKKYDLLVKNAKSILKKNQYEFKNFSPTDKKEWESYNVSQVMTKSFISDYLKEIYRECDRLTQAPIHSESETVLINNVCDNIITIMKKTYEYGFDYYPLFIELLKRFSYFNYPINEVKRISNLILFDRSKDGYLFENYYYDTNGRYIGVLPFLYENGGKDLCLFNDLFNLLLNSSIKITDFDTLLDFCVFISDEKYILRVKEVINK